jgi:hypothetical protein
MVFGASLLSQPPGPSLTILNGEESKGLLVETAQVARRIDTGDSEKASDEAVEFVDVQEVLGRIRSSFRLDVLLWWAVLE